MITFDLEISDVLKGLLKQSETQCINGCCDPIEFREADLQAWLDSFGSQDAGNAAVAEVERISGELARIEADRVRVPGTAYDWLIIEARDLFADLVDKLDSTRRGMGPDA